MNILGASNVYWWLSRHWNTAEDSWGCIFTLTAFLYFILTNHQLEFLIQTILKCCSIFTQYLIKVWSPLIRVIKDAKFVSIALSLQLLPLWFSSFLISALSSSSQQSQWQCSIPLNGGIFLSEFMMNNYFGIDDKAMHSRKCNHRFKMSTLIIDGSCLIRRRVLFVLYLGWWKK